MSSTDTGNLFDVMVGFAKSNAASYGAGVIGDAADTKLQLVSTLANIRDSINASYGQIRATAYADKSVVLNATGRETPGVFGGMPFGFDVREGKSGSSVPVGSINLFSFTLKNNMPAGQTQHVVVSTTQPVANSFATAWKNGTTLAGASWDLVITSKSGQALPQMGAPNKAALDTIMSTAAAKYTWVLWGKVSGKNGDNFSIDDGSGVVISVIGTAGNSIANGDYVSVKGSLSGTTLTATSITKY